MSWLKAGSRFTGSSTAEKWLQGIVKNTTSSGAFISLSELTPTHDSLVFVQLSSMSKEELEDPAQVVEVGDEVMVRLLDVDETGQRLGSMI
eukprot:g29403.t1